MPFFKKATCLSKTILLFSVLIIVFVKYIFIYIATVEPLFLIVHARFANDNPSQKNQKAK